MNDNESVQDTLLCPKVIEDDPGEQEHEDDPLIPHRDNTGSVGRTP